MKKSEVIDQIADSIDLTRGELNSHQLATRILEELERLGMQPQGYMNYVGCSCCSHWVDDWESEDDT